MRHHDMACQKDQQAYVHLDHCVPGPGMSSDILESSNSLYPGCKCAVNCSNNSSPPCSCNIAYDTEKCLHEAYLLESSPPIFECNSKCTCSMTCTNRTTQQYHCLSKLNVFQTSKKGTGVYTEEFISKGTYVGEYVGEVLSSAQAKKRLADVKSEDSCFIVQYREHMSNGSTLVTNIDATHKGNLTRFINHSCSPNLVMVPVRSDSLLSRLCLFACRDVPVGVEVCFSYFGKAGAEIDSETNFGSKQCFCESKECVGYLPLEM